MASQDSTLGFRRGSGRLGPHSEKGARFIPRGPVLVARRGRRTVSAGPKAAQFHDPLDLEWFGRSRCRHKSSASHRDCGLTRGQTLFVAGAGEVKGEG